MSKFSPKIIFFDLADTLLHKPLLFQTIHKTIQAAGYQHDFSHLRQVHKQCREAIEFPDQTNRQFFLEFNHSFLCALGIVDDGELASSLYASCRNLAWEPFADTYCLSNLQHKLGIISNWNTSLQKIVEDFFPNTFNDVYGSAAIGLRKPELAFFERAFSNSGVNPSQVLYIGDSPRLDIAPALKLGVNAWLIDRDDNFPFFRGRKLKNLTDLHKELY